MFYIKELFMMAYMALVPRRIRWSVAFLMLSIKISRNVRNFPEAAQTLLTRLHTRFTLLCVRLRAHFDMFMSGAISPALSSHN